jgi:Type I restriction-modification system methyltransferase subunit
MTKQEQEELGKTLWAIADDLRGAMNADDFRDYMLSFLFLRYLSDNYEAAAQKELGRDYPEAGADDRRSPLSIWYGENEQDIEPFEQQMRRKVHYIIKPDYLWNSIAELARTQNDDLLHILQKGFKYIENESFASTFQGLFSEINWIRKSSARVTVPATPSYAPSSARLPKALPGSPPAVTCWAMPMNT